MQVLPHKIVSSFVAAQGSCMTHFNKAPSMTCWTMTKGRKQHCKDPLVSESSSACLDHVQLDSGCSKFFEIQQVSSYRFWSHKAGQIFNVFPLKKMIETVLDIPRKYAPQLCHQCILINDCDYWVMLHQKITEKAQDKKPISQMAPRYPEEISQKIVLDLRRWILSQISCGGNWPRKRGWLSSSPQFAFEQNSPSCVKIWALNLTKVEDAHQISSRTTLKWSCWKHKMLISFSEVTMAKLLNLMLISQAFHSIWLVFKMLLWIVKKCLGQKLWPDLSQKVRFSGL